MNAVLKVRSVGNSVGTILPAEVLTRLRVGVGDQLFVTETKDGVQLTAYDPAIEQQMTAARKIMKKRRNVLRELAK